MVLHSSHYNMLLLLITILSSVAVRAEMEIIGDCDCRCMINTQGLDQGGHCKTSYNGGLWCYVEPESKCLDKKETNGTGIGQYWSHQACRKSCTKVGSPLTFIERGKEFQQSMSWISDRGRHILRVDVPEHYEFQAMTAFIITHTDGYSIRKDNMAIKIGNHTTLMDFTSEYQLHELFYAHHNYTEKITNDTESKQHTLLIHQDHLSEDEVKSLDPVLRKVIGSSSFCRVRPKGVSESEFKDIKKGMKKPISSSSSRGSGFSLHPNRKKRSSPDECELMELHYKMVEKCLRLVFPDGREETVHHLMGTVKEGETISCYDDDDCSGEYPYFCKCDDDILTGDSVTDTERPPDPAKECGCVLQKKTRYGSGWPDNLVQTMEDVTTDRDCAKNCYGNDDCGYWTHNFGTKKCSLIALKYSSNIYDDEDSIAGNKACGSDHVLGM